MNCGERFCEKVFFRWQLPFKLTISFLQVKFKVLLRPKNTSSFSLDSKTMLRTVLTIVIAHTFCALEILGFPIGDAY